MSLDFKNTSHLNEKLEMLKALIELRVIKRDGMDLFFRLEDTSGKLGALRNTLLEGNKKDRIIGYDIDKIFQELYDLIYELQAIINIGEL